jgi:hypothetical protein
MFRLFVCTYHRRRSWLICSVMPFHRKSLMVHKDASTDSGAYTTSVIRVEQISHADSAGVPRPRPTAMQTFDMARICLRDICQNCLESFCLRAKMRENADLSCEVRPRRSSTEPINSALTGLPSAHPRNDENRLITLDSGHLETRRFDPCT